MSAFRFKQFSIHQDNTSMKVGTDSILFGSWLNLSISHKNILDVGTGTGILSLMLAQKSTKAKILAIEIDNNAYIQAIENASSSPWSDRIHIVHADAKVWSTHDKYDLIISNPPYFSNSLVSDTISKVYARHQLSFSLSDLVDIWNRQGAENSELACILPIDESEKLIDLINKSGYFLKKYTAVKPKINLVSNRAMMLFGKDKAPTVTSELCIRKKDGTYSEEYITLTKDFYLGL
jgi:tRNA1Val (adenine37-N6)-methyltransferase